MMPIDYKFGEFYFLFSDSEPALVAGYGSLMQQIMIKSRIG